jgi:hypothetical protein
LSQVVPFPGATHDHPLTFGDAIGRLLGSGEFAASTVDGTACADPRAPGEVTVPGTEPPVQVGVDDSIEDWQRLSGAIPGAAVTTTTSLLAALWPEHHLIFDQRVHQAANGLRIAASRDATTPDINPPVPGPIRRDVRHLPDRQGVDHRDGHRYRPRPARCGASPLELSRKVPSVTERTWKGYADALIAAIEADRS